MIRETEIDDVLRAWSAGESAALEATSARAGLVLRLADLQALVAVAGDVLPRRDVIATLFEAMQDPGIALRVWKLGELGRRRDVVGRLGPWLCLAVRHGDRVVAAIRGFDSPGRAWPELKPWSKVLARNRVRAEAWADAMAGDRVAFRRRAGAAIEPVPAHASEVDLIREIIERPDDDALRGVLADVLAERGDVRGRLMQLEAEIAALPPRDPARLQREALAGHLTRQHRRHLAGEVDDHASEFTFARGFVDSVTMTAAAFRDHGARLFRAQPIRKLIPKPLGDAEIAKLATGPLELVRALQLDNRDIERRVSLAPLAHARFARLQQLELVDMILGDGDVFATIEAPQLHELAITRGAIGLGVLAGLVSNRALCAALETLTIAASPLAPDPADPALLDRALASVELPKLRQLELDCPLLTEARVARLVARAPQFLASK